MSIFDGMNYTTYNTSMSVYVVYEMNDIIMLISLVRLYFLCKQFFNGSEFLTQRLQRIMILFGGKELDLFFGIRAYIKAYPVSFLWWSLFWSLLIFSFMVINLERPISSVSTHNSLDSWNNVIWYCVVTMTTGNLFCF